MSHWRRFVEYVDRTPGAFVAIGTVMFLAVVVLAIALGGGFAHA